MCSELTEPLGSNCTIMERERRYHKRMQAKLERPVNVCQNDEIEPNTTMADLQALVLGSYYILGENNSSLLQQWLGDD